MDEEMNREDQDSENTQDLRESFGDYLKRHREASGKSLDQIAMTTRIAKRFLIAFEENATSALPEPAFARGFLRAYVQEIGLDAEDSLYRYDQFRTGLAPTVVRELKRPTKFALLGENSDVTQVQRWIIWTVGAGIVAALLIVMTLYGLKLFHSPDRSPSMAQPVEMPVEKLSTPYDVLDSTDTNILPPEKPASTKSASSRPMMETPVRPSILTIMALKDGKISVRVDENALQEINLKQGEIQVLSVFREAEIRTSSKNAFTFQYNNKPLEVNGPEIKLFNRYLVNSKSLH